MKATGPTGAALWIRIGVLIFTLVGVLYSMGYLKFNPIGDEILNPPADSVPFNKKPSDVRGELNLCPTRVAELHFVNSERKIRIFQQGIKWLQETTQVLELEPLLMEKWLAQYCYVKIDQFALAEDASAPVIDDMVLKYVDGTEKHLQKRANGVFTVDGENIRSSALEAAYAQLNHQ